MSVRALVAVFAEADRLLEATREARAGGYLVRDVHTPYAVHGMDEAMGLRRTRLPFVCLVLGILGAGAKFWFQMWTSATSWPVNVGGKPLRSVPAFIPVTFEIMVLFAGVGTVCVFFLVARLWPGRKEVLVHPRVTDDRFVLTLIEGDAAFDPVAVGARMAQLGAVEVSERLVEEGGR